ncbi:hypothetical protein BPTFM16_00035 [Altererythrobacter insulae]|nr:hypothetical protein BPTFM16_00035 [Altererythrobacter insulae]
MNLTLRHRLSSIPNGAPLFALVYFSPQPQEESMTKKTKAAIGAAAIGSAAIAAALLYANKRKKKDEPKPTVPSGEKPETD